MMEQIAVGRLSKLHRHSVGRLLGRTLERDFLVLVLIALVAFFSLNSTSSTAFTSEANINNILGNQAVTGIIALGMVVPLVSGYFDLSVAAVAGVANVVTASMMEHGHSVL